jgi:phosphotransferase system, enzyme I, PtsP
MPPIDRDLIPGPRVILKQMRTVMAGRHSPQGRLDQVVRMIAVNMVAEVCSIYLQRGSGELELFATEGLNPEAIHKSRLRPGEGLVGQIGKTHRPLNLFDAPADPHFFFLPETGEEIYKSFLGVPILRGGLFTGVLTVQNRTSRHYGEEEVEALETVAMVLAEAIASGGLMEGEELGGDDLRSDAPLRLKGHSFADGIAVGHAVLHQPRVEVTHLIAEDIDLELKRLEKGLEELKSSVDDLLLAADQHLSGEPKDVLEAYRMFAHDRGWRDRMREAVMGGMTAEGAVERLQIDTRARMSNAPDPYLRERMHDFDDLANRLLRHLMGYEIIPKLTKDSILVARAMGPAELLEYDRGKLIGLLLEEGSQTAHVSIVAKALEIPLVGRAAGAVDRVEPDDTIIVDGESGEAHIRPTADVLEAYNHKRERRTKRQARYDADKELEAVTLDGHKIDLNINAGLLVDLPHLDETNANGIGLFRTELQFMIGARMPRLREQTEFYKAVLDTAGDRPVVFRTVDLGSDKVLPYLETEYEENPALGFRAIRLALARPGLLRYQIRALLAASAGRRIRLMFPMIAEVAEFVEARELVDKEIARLARLDRKLPSEILIGSMLEVPALAFQLDALFKQADFISIGSNDLLQFLFASDRANPQVADRYDRLSPPVLSFLSEVVAKAQRAGVSISLCGEMAGDPLEAMALIGLGFRQISMPPASVGPVKAMLRSLDAAKVECLIAGLKERGDHSVRSNFLEFATRNGVDLG